MKEKKVLIEIGNIRIKENDVRNVEIERYEEITNPQTNTTAGRWRFRGYSGTITGALKLVVRKEMLVDRNAVSDLESHLKKVAESNQLVLQAIDRISRRGE